MSGNFKQVQLATCAQLVSQCVCELNVQLLYFTGRERKKRFMSPETQRKTGQERKMRDYFQRWGLAQQAAFHKLEI